MSDQGGSRLRGAIVPVTPFQQNCAILWDEASKAGMVVDPGGDVDRILEAIDQTGAQIEKIVLTHGHLDHAGGAAGLRDALQARSGGAIPIEGPDERDAFLLNDIAEQAASYGFDASNVRPDRWMMEGDVLTLGPHRFDVLHCPGHTPARWCSSTTTPGSRWSATCCFRVRSGAPTFLTATTQH
jgi:hydroxyacylglutathione hydrolase